MAPTREVTFAKDEKVLGFHHDMLYEAKVIESKPSDEKDRKSPLLYRIHYKGWKATWDEWVPGDRLKKFNEENLEMSRNLKKSLDEQRMANDPKFAKKKKAESALNSNRGSEDRQVGGTTGRGQKRQREDHMEKETDFLSRPAVRLPLPDHLKSILVDDWEYVTKNLSIVQLPSENPVVKILDAYFDEELKKRPPGSPEIDILEEVIAGLKEYFELCLGRILLYRFERQQFFEIKQAVEGNMTKPASQEMIDLKGKAYGEIYGAEHLLRLFVSLPELIAQTNMDAQSVKKLKDEITALSHWLAKHSARFFTQPYTQASQQYQELTKGLNDDGRRIDKEREGRKEYALR